MSELTCIEVGIETTTEVREVTLRKRSGGPRTAEGKVAGKFPVDGARPTCAERSRVGSR